MIDLSRRGGARGVRGEIYRIAGIIFQKESRRGQTLSWWRHRVVVKGPREEWDAGRGGGQGQGLSGERSGQAGWLAGRVGGGPCIDSQPLSFSLSPPTEV